MTSSSIRGAVIKRIALRTFIGSIVLSAVLGIAAILGLGPREGRLQIVLTSLSVTAGSACWLACAAAFEAGRARVVAVAGMLMALGATPLLLSVVWSDRVDNDLVRATGVAWTVLVACAHTAALHVPRLRGAGEIVRLLAAIGGFLLAALVVVVILADSRGDGALILRGIGVLSVLTSALTLAVPVFARLARGEPDEAGDDDPDRVERFCPYCGEKHHEGEGTVRCPSCGRRYTLRAA